jgi:tetratricopeptide (TPR) repeat protein
MESDAGQLPLSHKAWGWFEANTKQVIWGTGIILAAGVIIAFFLYRQNEADIAASEALSNLSMPQTSGASTRAESAEAYLKVAATYPKSRAGARALLLAAGSLFVEGKYPEAKTQFERFKREYGDRPFIGGALLGIAACWDAQGQTREAMAAYKDLIDRRPGDRNVSHAKFALGRLHAAQNEPEKARALFEDVERTDPYGSLGDEARMQMEDLKTKYPKLFAPIAPMSTNTAPTISAAPTLNAPSPTNSLPPKVEKP